MLHFRISPLSPRQNATARYMHANEISFRDMVQSRPSDSHHETKRGPSSEFNKLGDPKYK